MPFQSTLQQIEITLTGQGWKLRLRQGDCCLVASPEPNGFNNCHLKDVDNHSYFSSFHEVIFLQSFFPENVFTNPLRENRRYVLTIGLLNQDEVMDFVDMIRSREGIVPPENAEELAFNLEHYPPEQFEEEAVKVLEKFIEQMFVECMNDYGFAENKVDEPCSDDAMGQQIINGLMLPIFAEAFNKLFQPDKLKAHLSKVIARHIVVGYMELPPPIFSVPFGGVMPLNFAGMDYVVMIAGPDCNLEELFSGFRSQYRQTFGSGIRDRGPDKADKTAWQKAYAKYLQRHGEDEGRIDYKVAEVSFEIWPELKPDCDEASPEYEAAIVAEAERFRANKANFEEWQERIAPPFTRMISRHGAWFASQRWPIFRGGKPCPRAASC